MNNECSIVKDLLPLYAEDMVSPETAEFVAAHVAACPDCEKEYEAMKSGAPVPADLKADKAPLDGIKKAIRKRRLYTVVLVAALVAALLASGFAFMTTREYLPYSEAIAEVNVSDGLNYAVVYFKAGVTGYDYSRDPEPESGDVCRLEAWTTPWDRLFNRRSEPMCVTIYNVEGDGTLIYNHLTNYRAYITNASGNEQVVMSFDNRPLKPFSLYYCSNDGSEDVKLFGRTDINGLALPRLTLNYYFYGAAGLLLLLVAAVVIFRKNEAARKWLLRCAFMPASYIAAHLIVKGFGGASYSLMRDLSLIALITVLLFCALLTAHSIFLLKKEAKSV